MRVYAARARTHRLFSRLLRFIRRTRVTRDPVALIRALIACDYPGNYLGIHYESPNRDHAAIASRRLRVVCLVLYRSLSLGSIMRDLSRKDQFPRDSSESRLIACDLNAGETRREITLREKNARCL